MTSVFFNTYNEDNNNFCQTKVDHGLALLPSLKTIKSMNKKAAGVPGDIPMKLISEFSYEFSRPLSHLINSCFSQGIYPELWKMEYVTPVPNVYPLKN